MIRFSAPPSNNRPGSHQFVEAAALVAEHAVVVLGAGDALGDRPAHDADDVHHLGDHLGLAETAARHFVLHGQLPQRRAAAGIVLQHFRAGAEWHPRPLARHHRQHRAQSFDGPDSGNSGQDLVADETRGLHLDQLSAVGLVQQDFIGRETGCQAPRPPHSPARPPTAGFRNNRRTSKRAKPSRSITSIIPPPVEMARRVWVSRSPRSVSR